MTYPVTTPGQLRAVLQALRRARTLTQVELGERVGVSQKRIARIEGDPGVTGFDQIARLVAALGGQLVIEVGAKARAKPPPSAKHERW